MWTEKAYNSSFALNCTAYGYPTNITVTHTNTSINSTNVNFSKYSNTMGGFNFTSAIANNSGMFTCTASNGLISTNLTYDIFIGGMIPTV